LKVMAQKQDMLGEKKFIIVALTHDELGKKVL
jgi:hypothetical protein